MNYFVRAIRLAIGKCLKRRGRGEEKADCHGEIIDLGRNTKTGIIVTSFEVIYQADSYQDK